jgi:hypothetical protein
MQEAWPILGKNKKALGSHLKKALEKALGSHLNIRHFAGFLKLPLRLLVTHQPLRMAANRSLGRAAKKWRRSRSAR